MPQNFTAENHFFFYLWSLFRQNYHPPFRLFFVTIVARRFSLLQIFYFFLLCDKFENVPWHMAMLYNSIKEIHTKWRELKTMTFSMCIIGLGAQTAKQDNIL